VYLLGAVAIGWGARRRAEGGAGDGAGHGGRGADALAQVGWRLLEGRGARGGPMGLTAAAALAVNVFCASRLAPFKRGDASMRSIWLSTRNDAILNTATIAAAGLVALTATAWPDIAAGAADRRPEPVGGGGSAGARVAGASAALGATRDVA
jgi:hypothetical protein